MCYYFIVYMPSPWMKKVQCNVDINLSNYQCNSNVRHLYATSIWLVCINFDGLMNCSIYNINLYYTVRNTSFWLIGSIFIFICLCILADNIFSIIIDDSQFDIFFSFFSCCTRFLFQSMNINDFPFQSNEKIYI